MPKRVLVGRVTSDKMDKTRVVEIPRRVRHPKYGKFIRQRTVCYVHDENNDSHYGDTVKIIESAPISRSKRWRLVEVVERSREVDVAAMRAARRQAEQEAAEGLSAEVNADTTETTATVANTETASETPLQENEPNEQA